MEGVVLITALIAKWLTVELLLTRTKGLTVGKCLLNSNKGLVIDPFHLFTAL